ncbi:MAG: T9SS type A sorting domain-containing protein, partial [Bacteroidia bacterium]|nr:T9SS type A sorting domain-containing protein [Bacteroidia bacterium]
MSCSPTASPGPLPGTDCSNATLITALPYAVSGHTTQCYQNSYSTTPCVSNYAGEDHVYRYDATGPECTSITISGASGTGTPVLAVYFGCPSSGSCITPTPQVGNSVAQVTFPSAGTYYIVVDETGAGTYSNYNLNILTFGLAPANDLPCNAQYIDLLVNVNGNNTCTGSASEPGNPSCWTTGTLNTTWYSFMSPSSPNPSAVHIRATPGSIGLTQIALYSGSCSSLTQIACSQAGPSCASTPSPPTSDIVYSSLTPNTMYYVRVDGRNNNTGNYSIIVADVNGPQPYADGQDCVVPMTICNSSFTVGDPGFLGTGWVCDFGTSNSSCMFAGERSSAWYVFTTNDTGALSWRLTPNGGNVYVDYDWILMDITSFGSDQDSRVAGACPGINAGTLPWVRCNISDVILFAACATSQYQTGMCPSSTATSTTAFGPSFCSSLNVSPNQTFLLQLSNWTQNARGFNIDFNAFGASPIAYQNPPSFLYWTAGANTTDWFNPVNWGNCGPPDCNTNAIVTTGSSFMPVIATGLTGSCKNLDIKSGASVTMSGTAQLNICGNFANNGSLIAATTSTVNVQGPSAQPQYFDGNMIGSSKFGILRMNKPGQNMTILDNAQVGGSLSLANGFGGRIITGIKELYITNGAAAASNQGSPSSFVQGNLRRNLNGAAGLYYFPVGYAPPYNWQLAKVEFTAAHTIPNILSFFTPWSALPGAINTTDPACNWTYDVTPAFLNNGYWTMTASANPSSATYDMTLYNLNYTNAFAAGSGFTVMKAATIAGPWGLDGICSASTAAQAKRTGMTGFSVFATGQTTTVLPISLLNFDAVAQGTGVITTWVTASETNNDFFVIERSADGVNFEQVGTRKGAGNSSTTLYYSMLDLKPLKGMSYYRLRQVDFDGAESKSQLVAVSFLNNGVLNVFPNPAQTEIQYRFNSAADGVVTFELIDMLGKVFATQQVNVKKGLNTSEPFDIHLLPQGVYFVQLRPSGSEIIEPMQKRFVKQTKEE